MTTMVMVTTIGFFTINLMVKSERVLTTKDLNLILFVFRLVYLILFVLFRKITQGWWWNRWGDTRSLRQEIYF